MPARLQRRPLGRTGLEVTPLGVETIDVFLLGWVQGRWYLTGRTWPAMLRLKEEGKVRAVGTSTHKRRLATALAREFEPDVAMIRYNAARLEEVRRFGDAVHANARGGYRWMFR